LTTLGVAVEKYLVCFGKILVLTLDNTLPI